MSTYIDLFDLFISYRSTYPLLKIDKPRTKATCEFQHFYRGGGWLSGRNMVIERVLEEKTWRLQDMAEKRREMQ